MKKLTYALAVVAILSSSHAAFAAKPGGGSSASVVTGFTGRISYVCGRKICVMNLATGTNLTTSVSGANPKLSPDGSRIVYQSRGVWVMNSDGTNPAQVNADGAVPSWSPDGLKLAFHTSAGVFTQNVDGTGRTQVSTHGRSAAWSPDGSRIAFSSLQDAADYELWVMNADGSSASRVLTKPGSEIDVVWQPSAQIAFSNQGDGEIWKFDPATSALTQLTTSTGNDFEAGWEPGAAHLVFYSVRSPSGIWIMNADGSGAVSAGFSGRQPSWAP